MGRRKPKKQSKSHYCLAYSLSLRVIHLDFKLITAGLEAFMTCKSCQGLSGVQLQTKAQFGEKEWLRRRLYWEIMEQEERNNQMLRDLSMHYIQESNPKVIWFDKAPVNGMRLCWTNCMPFLYACKRDKIQEFKKRVERGDLTWVHQGKGAGKKASPQATSIIHRIQDLKDGFGESDPTDRKKCELPPGSFCGYWADYVIEMKMKGRQAPSYEWFRKCWRTHFPDLIIPCSGRLVRLVYFLQYL